MVWPWQRNRDPRGRGADPRVAGGTADTQAAPGADLDPDSDPDRGSGSVAQVDTRPGSSPLDDPAFASGLRPIPSGTTDAPATWPAVDVVGVSPAGEPIEVRLDEAGGRLLLAFLTTDCTGCRAFWDVLRRAEESHLPDDVSAVVVTRGPSVVASEEVTASTAGFGQVPVIMSDRAWTDYRVTSYPFFVVADTRSRTVIAETVGIGWDDVLSLLDPVT